MVDLTWKKRSPQRTGAVGQIRTGGGPRRRWLGPPGRMSVPRNQFPLLVQTTGTLITSLRQFELFLVLTSAQP